MATRKTSQPNRIGARKGARQGQPDVTTRRISAFVGLALVGLALLWFVGLYVHQAHPGLSFFTPAHTSPSTVSDPLAAAGITLAAPAQDQKPSLTRQQALVLANQMEPGIAAQAAVATAQYTLFSYKSPHASQAAFQDVPVWLIHYTHINEPRPDTAADSHASRAHHDFYVFLAASSGRELLAIWL